MTTHKFFKNIQLILLGTLVSVGLSYAATWTAPSGAAPTGNIDVPINAGLILQEKEGGLSVNTFAALGDAQLVQQAFVRGDLKGIDPGLVDPTLDIGGRDSSGSLKRVVATTTGNWNSGKTIGSTELRNTTLNRLCSTTTGEIILCPTGGTTPPPTPVWGPLLVENNFDLTQTSARITNITPSTWTLFEPPTNVFPIGPNLSRVGTHNATSAFSVVGTAPLPAHVLIIRNGQNYKCRDVPGGGAFAAAFSSPIAIEDDITIQLNPGGYCPITPGP